MKSSVIDLIVQNVLNFLQYLGKILILKIQYPAARNLNCLYFSKCVAVLPTWNQAGPAAWVINYERLFDSGEVTRIFSGTILNRSSATLHLNFITIYYINDCNTLKRWFIELCLYTQDCPVPLVQKFLTFL